MTFIQQRFVQEPQPTRVVFGAGRLTELGGEVDALGLRRVLVLSTAGHRDLAEHVAGLLGDRAVGVHARAAMHVPVESADAVVAAARGASADGCVAVGGGSTVGLGKALALREGLPIVAVPTTYSGSEMTPVWGLTERGEKRTGRDLRVRPATVLYDPELTTSLPVALSVTSAVNALAHAAEALYAPDTTPVVSLMAEEAARALAGGLPAVAAAPADVDARSQLLYGAWLAGACLGVTTMGLHHKLCHVLGGNLGLPHAETHTVILPHVLAFNAAAAPEAFAALHRALGGDPAAAVTELTARLGGPTSLAQLGVDRAALPALARQAAASPYANPRAASTEDITALLDAAWSAPRHEKALT